MAIARKAFNEMYPLWIDKNLPKKLKLHLYEASVLSILTHLRGVEPHREGRQRRTASHAQGLEREMPSDTLPNRR